MKRIGTQMNFRNKSKRIKIPRYIKDITCKGSEYDSYTFNTNCKY